MKSVATTCEDLKAPLPEVHSWERVFSGDYVSGFGIDDSHLDCSDVNRAGFLDLLESCGREDETLASILEVAIKDLREMEVDEREEAVLGSFLAKRWAVRSALKSLKNFTETNLNHRSELPWVLRRHLARAVRHAAAEVLHSYYETERERLAEARAAVQAQENLGGS